MQKGSLKIGINLGGWISQYKAFDRHHFETFITCDDIKKIADWGFDHVRLPVDYPILEDDENPGVYLESGFAYLDHCLQWCKENGLRVIFDIHRAPGYSFTNTLEVENKGINSLFVDPSMQQRFLNLWKAITKRYLNQELDTLAFELLNEMVLPESSPWNFLAQKVINEIRVLDPERLIIIGGNNYNAANELTNIRVNPDPNMLYTFHFYDPLVVTHQKAYWVIELLKFNQAVQYPGEAPELENFIQTNFPESIYRFNNAFGRKLDRNLLFDLLNPVRQFIKQTGNPVYCGEFGVIDLAPMPTRINWTRDFVNILSENQIGYAYWAYKEMDFGLVDNSGKLINADLLKAVTQK